MALKKSLHVTSSVNWGEDDNAPSGIICNRVCEHLAERLVDIRHSACDSSLMLMKMISVIILYIGIQPFRTFRNLKGHLDQCFSNFQVQQNDLLTKKKKKKGGPRSSPGFPGGGGHRFSAYNQLPRYQPSLASLESRPQAEPTPLWTCPG